MSIEYIIGDCRDVLKTMPDNSINCCVTSPPYYGLRQYFAAGVQLRSDLSEDERIYVLSELAKYNVEALL
jgi:DNA modification methylase